MNNSAPAAYVKSGIDASFCIGEAWEIVKRNPFIFIGAGVLVFLLNSLPWLQFLLIGPAMGGFAFLTLRGIQKDEINFGMVFKGFQRFPKLLVVGLVQVIPGILFQIVQVVMEAYESVSLPADTDPNFFQQETPIFTYGPGFTFAVILFFIGYIIFSIIWQRSLMFSIPLIVEYDAKLGEAITLSLSAMFNNIGGIIVLGLYGFFVALLGMLALCIGLIVAIPVIMAADVVAYRQVFPSDHGDDFAYSGVGGSGSIFGLDRN